MDNFRKGFLSAATFASDQNGHVSRGGLHSDLDGMVEQWTVADYAKPLFYTLNL